MAPITGSCLCGAVRIEIDEVAGPLELCHCNRCRKLAGSAFLAAIEVRAEHFRFIAGQDQIDTYDAPILHAPPAYQSCFCRNCGSTTPSPIVDGEFLEVPAGMLDDDPGIKPDKHILIEHRASWHEIEDDLPQLTGPQIHAERQRSD
tara:strand:+ start:146 stop:586 length:441 start_codon:yes stop_codon:yes gene_type:complete